MSELIQKHDNRATIRWKLLTGVSALALTAYVSSAGLAHAEDGSQPQVWVELDGALNRQQAGQEVFSPPIMDIRPSIFTSSEKFERPSLFGFDETVNILFQPKDSSWSFVASIQYGRSARNKHVHQQIYASPFVKYYPFGGTLTINPMAAKFADTKARNTEQHTILDFKAGKDFGLGLFGSTKGSSTIAVGVRFAQFKSGSNVALKSDPDWHFKYYINYNNFTYIPSQSYHSNRAEFDAQRSFRGLGPSLSWKSSIPFAGNPQESELALDWGISAALLFGKQKARTHHQATGFYQHGTFNWKYPQHPDVVYQAPPVNSERSKSVTVPNIGGFAGISFRYADAKISLGYKADFFFGAIDGGIDAAKKENRGFYGPYASISIGLGD